MADDKETDADAIAAARYYRKLIAEGVPPADAVKMTASWIAGQVVAETLEPDTNKEPWQE